MPPSPTPSPEKPGTVALLAAVYPAVSETFVYREALGLLARGWRVYPVSLHELSDDRRAEGVPRAALTVYGPATPRTLAAALGELIAHPLRAARTLGLALRDAILPGEPTRAVGRLRVLALAVLALGLARQLRRWDVDHVHCHFANGPTTLGMYAAAQLGRPFSFVGHANDLFDRRSTLRRKLERAAFVSCISEWHRTWYRTLCDRAPERYELIRCGVDVAAWRPQQARSGSDVLQVLCVARLIPKKGVDALIRALCHAGLEHGLAWRLCVVGGGPERARLEALAREFGVAHAVEFAGAVANDEVARRMARADVFALPCRTDRLGDRDGIPVVLMEAMAAELPVVVGDLPTIRELVRHGETGMLVPGDDVSALATALVELARDPAARARLGAAGRRTVERDFALDANMDALDRALRRRRSG